MSSGERWQVVVHDDDYNPMSVVYHLLRKVCGASDAVAREKVLQIHQSGRAVAGEHESRDEAEATTVSLLRFGLHATFGQV